MSYQICEETGNKIRGDCEQLEDQGYETCDRWEDQGYESCAQWEENCCDWWPCSWFCWLITLFCNAWVWISNIVCVFYVWISNLVCVVYSYIAEVTCKVVMIIVTVIMRLIEKIISIILQIIRSTTSLFGICLPTYCNEDEFNFTLTSSAVDSINGREDVFSDTVATPEGLHLLYLGTNSIYISDGITNILIDPYFTRPEIKSAMMPLCSYIEIMPQQKIIRNVLDGAKISKLDAVLITHSHYDHALDIAEAIIYLTRPDISSPVLYGSESTYYVGKGGGVPDSQIKVITEHENYNIGNFEVQFILSEHLYIPFVGSRLMGDISGPIMPPANLFEYKDGGTYAIYIKHKLGTILNIGSANYKENALDFLKNKVDTLIVGIAGFDQNAVPAFDHPTYRHDFYNEVVRSTNPKQIFFSHWDDFNYPLDQIPKCYKNPMDTYNFFIEEDSNLKPYFMPIGRYIQL